jgi:predicted nucleotidyltransferase
MRGFIGGIIDTVRQPMHAILRPMVTPADIQKLADDIARLYQPERIILFGSYAYGTPHRYSDVDLLIVMPFEGDTLDFRMKIWASVRPKFSVDMLIRRPEDTVRRYAQFDPLIREALDKGKVLYERDRARVA